MPANAKKEWSKSETEELIEMYRNKRELWDFKCKHYKNRSKRMISIGEMASHFCTTLEEITRKIHNLRVQYNGELKRIKKDQYSVTKWPYYNLLSFLHGIISQSKENVIMESNNEDVGTNDEQIDQDLDNHIEVETVMYCEDSDETQNNEQNDDKDRVKEIHNILYTREDIDDILRKKRKRNTVKQKTRKKICANTSHQEDQYDVFGKYVACEMRNLSFEYLRKKMKKKFQQIVLEINKEEQEQM